MRRTFYSFEKSPAKIYGKTVRRIIVREDISLHRRIYSNVRKDAFVFVNGCISKFDPPLELSMQYPKLVTPRQWSLYSDYVSRSREFLFLPTSRVKIEYPGERATLLCTAGFFSPSFPEYILGKKSLRSLLRRNIPSEENSEGSRRQMAAVPSKDTDGCPAITFLPAPTASTVPVLQ